METPTFEWKKPPKTPITIDQYSPRYVREMIDEYKEAYGPDGTEDKKRHFSNGSNLYALMAILDAMKYCGYPSIEGIERSKLINLISKDPYAKKRFKLFQNTFEVWVNHVFEKCDLLSKDDKDKGWARHTILSDVYSHYFHRLEPVYGRLSKAAKQTTLTK